MTDDPRTGVQWQCQTCGKFIDPEEAFYDCDPESTPEPYCSQTCAPDPPAAGYH